MRIIYLDIDSLRPDHMGCYGYARDTTPHIDSIAARGVRFDRAYTASSPCGPARTSFVTGMYAINHGALNHGEQSPGGRFQRPRGPFFTRTLRSAGYRTISFSSFADRHAAWHFNAAWNELHNFSLKRGWEDASEVNAAVLPWLREHGRDDNWFLHVQYWDPHIEHRTGGGLPHNHFAEYVGRFQGQPLDLFPDEDVIQQHRAFPQPCGAVHLMANFGRFFWTRDNSNLPPTMVPEITSRADYELVIDGYDAAIWYMDQHVGDLLATLREIGIEDEVGFIITADHGESWGEHGIYAEHVGATEPVNHVPMVISLPGVTAEGTSTDALIYNVDMVATVAELCGAEIPQQWDGVSFLPALRGQPFAGHEYVVMDHALFVAQRSVFDGRWFFLRTLHPGLFNFGEIALYDQANDPHQTRNLAAERPDIVGLMEHRLNMWTQAQRNKPWSIPDPLQEVALAGPWTILRLDEWTTRLREDGWVAHADALAARFVRDPRGYR